MVLQLLASAQLLIWVLFERQLAQPEHVQLSAQVKLIVTVPLALLAEQVAENNAAKARDTMIIPIFCERSVFISAYLSICSATNDIVFVHAPLKPDMGIEIFQKMSLGVNSISSDCGISMASIMDASDSGVMMP